MSWSPARARREMVEDTPCCRAPDATGRRVEHVIFTLFAALVIAGVMGVLELVLRAAGAEQFAIYDIARAAVLFPALLILQSARRARRSDAAAQRLRSRRASLPAQPLAPRPSASRTWLVQ